MNEKEYLHSMSEAFDYIFDRNTLISIYEADRAEPPNIPDLLLVTHIIAAATLKNLRLPDAVSIFSFVAVYETYHFTFLLFILPWIPSACFQFGLCPTTATWIPVTQCSLIPVMRPVSP